MAPDWSSEEIVLGPGDSAASGEGGGEAGQEIPSQALPARVSVSASDTKLRSPGVSMHPASRVTHYDVPIFFLKTTYLRAPVFVAIPVRFTETNSESNTVLAFVVTAVRPLP